MARYLSSPLAPLRDLKVVVPISKGGTSGATAVEAVTAIGGIHKSKLGIANGLAQLGTDAKIQKNQLPDAVVPFSTLRGPKALTVNQVATYKISNYDVTTTYTVTISSGTATVTGDTITVTAPATAQTVNLTVNSRVVPIVVSVARPAKPTLGVNSTGIGTSGILIANSSQFAMTSGSGIHRSSDWQIATDAGFTLLVSNIQDDQVNKLALVTSDLSLESTYYVRIRHRDSNNNASDWSDVFKVKVGSNFTLNKEEAKITAFDKGASDYFGEGAEAIAVSSDGSRLVVGAHFSDIGVANTGAVYVYKRSGTTWALESKLSASDKATGDEFGISVAINSDGSRIIVGAWKADAGATDSGAVYVFTRNDITWTQEAKLVASDKVASDYFGFSVDINDDATRVVIGAYCADAGAADSGAAYIFSRSGTTWTQEAKLVASDKAASDYFGTRVKMSTDSTRVAISANYADVGATDTGAVYIFSRSGTTWTQEAKLIASDRVAGDTFGVSISFTGDASRIAIGAYGVDGGVTDSGAVYVFTRSGTIWTQEAKLIASDRVAGDGFGMSVSISADASRIAIGAYAADISGAVDVGAVYVFVRSGSTWLQENKILASDRAANDSFGRCVELTPSANRLFVSAHRADPGAITDAGAVYVYST